MTRILFVEDEIDFCDRFTAELKKIDKSLEVVDIRGFTAKVKGGGPIEEQFADWVQGLETTSGSFGGALLDTDLSANREGVSQSLARQALHKLGIPTCRYSKKGTARDSDRLRLLKRFMSEGPQAVPFPPDINLAEDVSGAASWSLKLFLSFADLARKAASARKKGDGPASMLARALDEPDAEVDFAAYGEAYPYYFADLLQEDQGDGFHRRQHTQLGYWFVNCILAFPGPILNSGAAAAVLGLPDGADVESSEISAAVNSCRYKGPFWSLRLLFWRSKLLDLLDDQAFVTALQSAYRSKGVEGDIRGLRYCLVQDKPMTGEQAPSRPDWIPAGAIESYIERNLYTKLNPWIKDS